MNPGEPCCDITSINTSTGVVTAKVNATGQTFQFNAGSVLSQLHVGQAIYANLATKQVSLDGAAPCCGIISVGAAPVDGVRTAAPVDGARVAKGAVNPATPCCDITGIDASTGVVTARVNATGQTFQFRLSNAAQVHQLRAGQGVFANLAHKQVSLDGKTIAGAITTASSAADNQAAGGSQPSVASTPAGEALATPPDFSIAFAPNSPTSAPAGTNVTYTLNIGPIGSFNGDVQLSAKINGVRSTPISPASVSLGCQASSSGTVQTTKLNCADAAAAQLTVVAALGTANTTGGVPTNSTETIEVDATYTRPNLVQGSETSTPTITHSAQITLTPTMPTVPPPVSMSCGGTSNPLTADTCGKTGSVATNLGIVACGASITITGNTFPAGSSDWFAFTIPTSRANCASPLLIIRISSSPGSQNVFDVVHGSPTGTAVFNSWGTYTGGPSVAVNGAAGLGSANAPLESGIYYIRIYAVQGSTGTWTLTITG
ncbi:MAG TPA: hypothetical protein VLY23_06230 [Candidatus Acidoferrum sp.]|nr:hypothetical protein [Candidatus Acidoferrum sp.]